MLVGLTHRSASQLVGFVSPECQHQILSEETCDGRIFFLWSCMNPARSRRLATRLESNREHYVLGLAAHIFYFLPIEQGSGAVVLFFSAVWFVTCWWWHAASKHCQCPQAHLPKSRQLTCRLPTCRVQVSRASRSPLVARSLHVARQTYRNYDAWRVLLDHACATKSAQRAHSTNGARLVGGLRSGCSRFFCALLAARRRRRKSLLRGR